MLKKGILIILFLITLISFSSAYEIQYFHTDGLGSPVLITDENASVVWSADYEPFGKSFNEFGAENSEGNNSYQYNGKELDKSGLLYYGARYYDADLGRFVTADTIKGNIKSPQTLNRYVYVLNNPMKYIDPTGNRISFNNQYVGGRFVELFNNLIGREAFGVEDNTLIINSNFNREKLNGQKLDLFNFIEKGINSKINIGVNWGGSSSMYVPGSDGLSGQALIGNFNKPVPLGSNGNFISLGIEEMFVHELAHGIGFGGLPQNSPVFNPITNELEGFAPVYGEVDAVRAENLVRSIKGKEPIVYYAHGENFRGSGFTYPIEEYEFYFTPKVYDEVTSIYIDSVKKGGSSDFDYSPYLFQRGEIIPKSHWPPGVTSPFIP